MQEYDVILIHPPAIYDFRKRHIFPGAMGSTVEQVQLNKVAIGVLSIADYLDRHNYKVIIDNLADRMVASKGFDVVEHIKDSKAKVYAIGLHWQQHSQGAIEIAKLCKELHPDSLVVMGGLTATRFNEEIIQKYKFVDAIIRGEAEKPFLEFMKSIDLYGKITGTPNLTYRGDKNEMCVTPLMTPSDTLDEYEFTRLDLVEPKSSIFSEPVPRWSLEVCRGCTYNCNICGGSAYTYKKYLGREKPAFRSPEKLVQDIISLGEQGVKFVGIYQDPRMGGYKYWKELMELIRIKRPNIKRLTFDIFSPVDEEFVKAVAIIGIQVILYICPDSGSYCVRGSLGRFYTNEEILNTVALCHRYHIPVVTFFSVGLAGETSDEISETCDLWEQLRKLDQKAVIKGSFGNARDETPIGGPAIGPIFVDPGSIAYDSPEENGYKIRFRNLEEYISGLSNPSWHQWLNYETNTMGTDKIIESIYETLEFSIDQRQAFGIYNEKEANNRRLLSKIDKIAINEVDKIMDIKDLTEREKKLACLKAAVTSIPIGSYNLDDLNTYINDYYNKHL